MAQDIDADLIQAVIESVNESQGDPRVDPDKEVERLKSVVEAAFWDQWEWVTNDEGDDQPA